MPDDEAAETPPRQVLGTSRPLATIREAMAGPEAATKTIREAGLSTRTQRETKDSSSLPSSTLREEDAEAGTYATPLPRSLASRFSSYEELPAMGGEADCFVVRDENGEQKFLKVYRLGVDPNTEILEKLLEADPEHIIRLIDFNCCRERRWWELQEYVTFGTLEEYVRQRGGRLSPSDAQVVLEELLPAIEHLHGLGIEHKDLKPDNILVRASEPRLDLVITDFGIASMLDESVRFTKAHRTIRYAPPEAQHGVVIRHKWDYWSLGIILIEMVTGRHPFAELSEQRIGYQLSTIFVDDLVPEDMDPYWRSLCRGFLRRDPNNRWGADECRRWLVARDDPALVVVEEAPPRSADQAVAAGRPSPPFAGKTYNSPEALAEAMAENWDDATEFWQTRQAALFDWLRQDLGLGPLASQLAAFDKDQSLLLQAQIFSVIHVLDPVRPLSFRGRGVTADALKEIALGTHMGRGDDGSFLRQLQAESILTVGAVLRPEEEIASIAASWNAAIGAFRRASDQIRTNVTGVEVPDLDSDLLAQLLAATTDGRVLDELENEANRAPTTGGQNVTWYTALGDTSVDSAAASAMLRIALASEANSQAKELRAGRAARNKELWGHMGLGAMFAVIGGFLWWEGANAFCNGGEQFCTQFAWQNQKINLVDMIYVAAAVIAVIATLVTVQSRTTSKD